MARETVFFGIAHVARKTDENLELLEQVAMNGDNIDYGEMIYVHDGSVEGITAFTERGIESLQEFLADVRSWRGGSESSSSIRTASPTSSRASWQTSPKPDRLWSTLDAYFRSRQISRLML